MIIKKNPKVPGISGNVDMNEAYFGHSAPANNVPTPEETNSLLDSINFEEVNDVVAALSAINVRNLPTTVGSEVVGVLRKSNGDTVKRISIGDNGWFKIIYNNQVAYANTKYLVVVSEGETEAPTVPSPEPPTEPPTESSPEPTTTQAPEETTEQKQFENVEGVATLTKGATIKRIGISKDGWSKSEYEDKIVYAKSELLMIESPDETTQHTD